MWSGWHGLGMVFLQALPSFILLSCYFTQCLPFPSPIRPKLSPSCHPVSFSFVSVPLPLRTSLWTLYSKLESLCSLPSELPWLYPYAGFSCAGFGYLASFSVFMNAVCFSASSFWAPPCLILLLFPEDSALYPSISLNTAALSTYYILDSRLEVGGASTQSLSRSLARRERTELKPSQRPR